MWKEKNISGSLRATGSPPLRSKDRADGPVFVSAEGLTASDRPSSNPRDCGNAPLDKNLSIRNDLVSQVLQKLLRLSCIECDFGEKRYMKSAGAAASAPTSMGNEIARVTPFMMNSPNSQAKPEGAGTRGNGVPT
jgi:hypothetical protein